MSDDPRFTDKIDVDTETTQVLSPKYRTAAKDVTTRTKDPKFEEPAITPVKESRYTESINLSEEETQVLSPRYRFDKSAITTKTSGSKRAGSEAEDNDEHN